MKQGHLIAYARVNAISSAVLAPLPVASISLRTKHQGVRNEYPPFGVNRATIDPLPGLGANAKTRPETVSADR